jgi:chromosome segregation ATPase
MKVSLAHSEKRLHELSDFDNQLAEKNREIEEYRKKIVCLSTELSEVRVHRDKLEEDVGNMIQTLVQCSLEKGRLNNELHSQTAINETLTKENSSLQKKI